MDFARRAYDQSSQDEEYKSNTLDYDDIQRLVHSDPRYDFLIDATPKRIKFGEALKLVQEANEREAIRKQEETLWMEERRKDVEKRKLESKLKQDAKKAAESTTERIQEDQKDTIDMLDNNSIKVENEEITKEIKEEEEES